MIFTTFEFLFFFLVFFSACLFFGNNFYKTKNAFFLFLAGFFLLFCWGLIYNGVPVQTGITVEDVNSSYHIINTNYTFDGGPSSGSIFVYILQIMLAVASGLIILYSSFLLLNNVADPIIRKYRK